MDLPPSAQLTQMITGCVTTQAVYIAAKLGLADLLKAGPRSVHDLAKKAKQNEHALHRVLRTLASSGVFTETQPGHFGLTPMAELLRSDRADSMQCFALMFGEMLYQPIGDMMYSVQTSKSSMEHFYGMPVFDYLSKHPDQAAIFDGAMSGIHGPETQAMIDAYDFRAFTTLVDVGGGNASTITPILQANPKLRGIVFDLPNVIERTRTLLQKAGISDRCKAEGGDFFKAVPRSADAYMLRHVIHDWDDEKSVAILRRCREAAEANAKLLVVESVIPPSNEPHPGKWLDLVMLTCPGGLERTADEYQSLLAKAGWKLTRIVPTKSPVSLIEGVPAQ